MYGFDLAKSLVPLTVVSSSRSERSSVTPEGTVSADKTMVAQSFWDTLASEYPSDPEKVQLVARLPLASAKSGAGVGRGAGTAKTEAAKLAARRAYRRDIIVIRQSKRRCVAGTGRPSWHLGVSGRVYIVVIASLLCCSVCAAEHKSLPRQDLLRS